MAKSISKPKAAKVSRGTTAGPIIVKRPVIQTLSVTVVGTSPLILHAWGEKLNALEKEQAEKDSGTAPKKRRQKRDPMKECEDAMYWLPGKKPAIPAVSFKRAMVGACRYVEGIDMTFARGLFFVLGDLLPIKGKWHMRKDAVRVPPVTGNADVRYRPEFPKWEVDLMIQYNANLISAEHLLNLLMLAGLHQGVGEMRPSAKQKDFTFGMFTIKEGRRKK